MLQHAHGEHGVGTDGDGSDQDKAVPEEAGALCSHQPLPEDGRDADHGERHAENAPACRPLQPEHRTQQQAPDRGGREHEAGVGGARHAHPVGERGLRHPDAQAAKPRHRQKVALLQPALGLEQPQHEQEQQPPDHEPEGYDG